MRQQLFGTTGRHWRGSYPLEETFAAFESLQQEGNAFPCTTTPGGLTLTEIARSRAATPQQIALAFLTRASSVFAIPKAIQPSHLEQNAAAADITLSSDDIVRLELAFPRGARPRFLPMI